MTDEQDVFDRAEADCLAECFKVLAVWLSIPGGGRLAERDPAAEFADCCGACRKAREIARGK